MSEELLGRLRERIAARGPLTFADFMRAALYEPGLGYYASGVARVGAAGDFYTSPAAHPAFGALLGVQLEEMWRLLGCPDPFVACEIGAGGGLLWRDLVTFVEGFAPEFHRRLDYRRVEVSGGAPWPPTPVVGCFFSNELFDALPVHRVRWVGGELWEVYIALGAQGQLVEVLAKPSTEVLARRLELEGVTLAEGQEAEVGLELAHVVSRMAEGLAQGYVVTIDYGDEAERLYASRRARGTLLAYRSHGVTDAVLDDPGSQDLTAHVDFTALMRAGSGRGLETCGLTTQAAFLRGLGWGRFMERLARSGLSPSERDANALALRELVSADGLGAFKVLVQSRAAPPGSLAGLGPGPGDELSRRLASGPLPLRHAGSIPLAEGRYPHRAGGWEEFLFDPDELAR